MINTIAWKNNYLRIIDQSQLPQRLVYLNLKTAAQVYSAIRRLKIRGAPAIGVAAAFGVILGLPKKRLKSFGQFKRHLHKLAAYLASARPTAVNLFWALERMENLALSNRQKNPAQIKKILLNQARQILNQDKQICRRMAKFGAKLIKNNDSILTHCNAGALATVDYGTALGVFYQAKKEKKKFKVFADETRPVLQGARLTCWELLQQKIDVTLICDNMAAQLMQQGRVDKIFVGADRIAANGDAANKIGTYNLAVLAGYHHIPFYIVAPLSSFDFKLKSGHKIPIEQRDPQEVRQVLGKQIAPKKVKVYNPAFDVTPHRLISAIVTERGIFYQPYKKTLKKLKC